uniref:B30.2/SPRY domain-containing protein n=1 Tax=Chelonoidis abingdonii TaxID=106734 RepID=A0A8C0GN09_CHEAB
MMSNGYKPGPAWTWPRSKLTRPTNTLVDKLAENFGTTCGPGPSAQGVPTARSERVRVFRAEQCYTVRAGRWYFEFEAVTTGEMRVGWARPDVRPDVELGADELAYVFNGHRGQRWHIGSEPFGRSWQPGDVVGCMIDLTENHIMFTLNGEMLISDSGSELAFKDIEIGEGEGLVLCCTVLCCVGRCPWLTPHSTCGLPICGCRRDFEPFALKHETHISMCFSKSLPQFSPIPPDAPSHEIQVHAGPHPHPQRPQPSPMRRQGCGPHSTSSAAQKSGPGVGGRGGREGERGALPPPEPPGGE